MTNPNTLDASQALLRDVQTEIRQQVEEMGRRARTLEAFAAALDTLLTADVRGNMYLVHNVSSALAEALDNRMQVNAVPQILHHTFLAVRS